MKLCLFSVDNTETTFGVDAACVVEFLRDLPITRVPLVSPKLLGLLNIHGEIVPVFLPPLMDDVAGESIRQLQRQGSYLVLEGGEAAGRFALPASHVDLADGDRPEDAAEGEWLFSTKTTLGREYSLIDVEALVATLHALVAESTPQPALAG